MKYLHHIGFLETEENCTYEELVKLATKWTSIVVCIVYSVSLIVTGMLIEKNEIHLLILTVGDIAVLLLCLNGIAYIKCRGFYIVKEEIFRWGILRHKKIPPKELKGIKVIRGSVRKHSKGYKNGGMYRMILLNTVHEDMRTYTGDFRSFKKSYRKYIIGMTRYDLPAINRLRELNPDLVVMYEE